MGGKVPAITLNTYMYVFLFIAGKCQFIVPEFHHFLAGIERQ